MQFTKDTLNREIKFIHNDGTKGQIQYKDIGTFTPVSSSNKLGQIIATLLFRCIEMGDIERIKSLTNVLEYDINEAYYVRPSHEGNNTLKRTALIYAIENIQFDVVKLLIEKGANIYVCHLGSAALRFASIVCNSNAGNPMSRDIYKYIKSIDDKIKNPKKNKPVVVITRSRQSYKKEIIFWFVLMVLSFICGRELKIYFNRSV
jgi:hypothetical protein